MGAIGEITLEDAAREAAGNWRSWTCFVWDREREIDDAENWSIVYTHNRDSGLLAQSNAAAIADVLRPFSETENPDVVFESHPHWAVGHVDGTPAGPALQRTRPVPKTWKRWTMDRPRHSPASLVLGIDFTSSPLDGVQLGANVTTIQRRCSTHVASDQ